MYKILITGLPGSGKTTLAKALSESLVDSIHIDGDQIRNMFGNDIGHGREDVHKQALRMRDVANSVGNHKSFVIASFVAPTQQVRQAFQPDFTIYVKAENRICPFPETQKMYEVPNSPNYTKNDDNLSYHVDKIMSRLSIFNPVEETALFVGRFQPFHAGHKALIIEGMKKARVDQAMIGVRATNPFDYENNPYSFEEVKTRIEKEMKGVKLSIVPFPNIVNIMYGRKVGYGITKVELSPELHAISATKIREEEKKCQEI